MEDDGRVLIYEGHDVPRTAEHPSPKNSDQEARTAGGALTENGRFLAVAEAAKDGSNSPESVFVYEKIRPGLWVYNGAFALVDGWLELAGQRHVFKFRLELADDPVAGPLSGRAPEQTRLIPSAVKLEVWKRDAGQCVDCGKTDNLHFDHIIPYSRGGSSLVAENIQILCARHNLEKHDSIE